DDAPLATVKLNFPENETFDECVKRITEAIHEGRSGRNSRIDREVRFLTKLPGPLLRMVIAAGEWLDRWNLLPGFMIDPDPMYTSMFLANLGSLNIDSRSEEHTSELQSLAYLVCRLLLEKKK